MIRDNENSEDKEVALNLNVDGGIPAALAAGTAAASAAALRFIRIAPRFMAVLAARGGINRSAGQRGACLRLNVRHGLRSQILRRRSGQGRWQYRCHLHRISPLGNPVSRSLLCQKRGENSLNVLVGNWLYSKNGFRPEFSFFNRNETEYCPCGIARKP